MEFTRHDSKRKGESAAENCSTLIVLGRALSQTFRVRFCGWRSILVSTRALQIGVLRIFPQSKSSIMASKTRDARVIAAVACPTCGARAGEPCRNPVPHQTIRGPEDRRAQPVRPHIERRAEWVATKPR